MESLKGYSSLNYKFSIPFGSERILMEQLDYDLLFRWFVGLNMDDAIWKATGFSKDRRRLLDGDIALAFFDAVLRQFC